MAHTHDIKIDTPSIDEVGDLSFTNGDGCGFSMPSLDATLEQREELNRIFSHLDKFNLLCGGISEFRVKVKP